MANKLEIICAVALVSLSCSRGVSRIQTHPLPVVNPTTCSFPMPVETVHAKALEAFSQEHQASQPIFAGSGTAANLERSLKAECATNAVFGQPIFSNPANAQDIFLHSFHSPFVLSPVYCGRNGGLPFMASFHLHLAGDGSGTVVSVTASDAQVINGTKFGIGSCGPGQMNHYVDVKPTTIEEYSILCYLGSYLGVTNMPAVIVPK